MVVVSSGAAKSVGGITGEIEALITSEALELQYFGLMNCFFFFL